MPVRFSSVIGEADQSKPISIFGRCLSPPHRGQFLGSIRLTYFCPNQIPPLLLPGQGLHGILSRAVRNRRVVILAGTLLVAALLGALLMPSLGSFARRVLPPVWFAALQSYRLGYVADHSVRITMRDGVRLAASLYLPRTRPSPVATVYVRMPYDRFTYPEGVRAAEFFGSQGYAVLVQDIRGTHESEGTFEPYRHATDDGAATLDWIVAQPWSNGRVGTFGCSALGELQFALARARHTAHRAMIPIGAGGAVGSALGRYAYFGVFEGGIFQLASGFGWLLPNGAHSPSAAPLGPVDIAAALRALPTARLVQRVRPGPNSFDAFVSTPLTDRYWQGLDYLSDADDLSVPALVVNTWGDQTVGDTLALAEAMRVRGGESGAPQHVVIAPGGHCDNEGVIERGRYGAVEMAGAAQPYLQWYKRWFDFWLRDIGSGLADLPPYLFYMIGEARWLSASSWPPAESRAERWYLDSDGRANTRDGDGRLSPQAPAADRFDQYRYDPANPVPSRGGPMCCTGNPSEPEGPVDQAPVEQRADVLVYTSGPLTTPLRIAGPLHARLRVSSSARDTDLVARLVHVRPDGLATNIQEGALRLRYRLGIDRPSRLEPGEVVEAVVDMRSIAYTVPAGHRLRLQVTSSSFPRLERNLNTGGRNFDETVGVVAETRVHHGPDGASYVELPVLSPGM